MCKALKQNISEKAESNWYKFCELFKDMHNLHEIFFAISQPWFPLTALKQHIKAEPWFISWQLPYWCYNHNCYIRR